MTQHYSTRAFFRQMPNIFLARYFAAREVLPDFDFTAMTETKIDALFDAWMELAEASRVGMESELRKRKNLPKVTAAVEPTDIAALSEAIRAYYRVTEGRGLRCKVEPYRRGDLDYVLHLPRGLRTKCAGMAWLGVSDAVTPPAV